MSLETLQWVSPVIIVSAAFLFILLEKYFPYNKGRRLFRPGFWMDLIGYGLIQSYLLGLIISNLIWYIDNSTGISRFHLVSDWPIWVQVVFFIVTHDLATYLIHRTQHRSKFLFRFHEAHHSAEDVDWLAGIRSHSGEIMIYQMVEYLPIVLLGAAPEVPLYKAIANSTYGMYIHANLRFRMGPLLYILNGPELHRWHHANNDVAAYDKNFATKFAIWDFMFGTVFNPKDAIADEFGPGDPNFPRSYMGQLLHAFKRRQNS